MQIRCSCELSGFANRPHGGFHIRGLESRGTCHEDARTGARGRDRSGRVDSPVNLHEEAERALVAQADGLLDLGHHFGHEGLPSESGNDRHGEKEVNLIEVGFNG